MPTEHRAVLLLLGLAVAGHGVRYLLTRPGEAPGAVTLLGTGPARSPAAQRDSVISRARPLRAGERVDLDRATVTELDRLPGVGGGLARRIVADRERRGAFGSLAGLDRVAGVGPALLRDLGEWVTFSSPAPAYAGGPVNLNSAPRAALLTLPGIGQSKADAIVAYREAHGPFASLDALLSVPGIGPSILARIKELAVVQ